MAEESFPEHDYDEDQLNEHVFDPGDPDGVVEAEKRRIWEEKHPNLSTKPHTAHKSKHHFLKVLVGVFLLSAAVYGAYAFGNHQANKSNRLNKVPTESSNHQQQSTQQQTTVQTKNYSSTNFGISFDYPSDWVINDTTIKLTVTSPSMQLMTAVGSKTDAHIIVTVQNQQTSISGFPSGGAMASIASDKLTYKQPSTVQRAQTFLSYLSYTQQDGLDALYLTGDSGYQQGQQVPMSDVIKGNPLIGVGFEKCAAGNCNGSTDSVTLQASNWKSSMAGNEVTNLLESIIINQ